MGPTFGENELAILFLESNEGLVISNQNGTYGFTEGSEYFYQLILDIEVYKVSF
jgi:hypothetical protein